MGSCTRKKKGGRLACCGIGGSRSRSRRSHRRKRVTGRCYRKSKSKTRRRLTRKRRFRQRGGSGAGGYSGGRDTLFPLEITNPWRKIMDFPTNIYNTYAGYPKTVSVDPWVQPGLENQTGQFQYGVDLRNITTSAQNSVPKVKL